MVEKLGQKLAQSKETTCGLKSSIGALRGQHDVLQKTHQDLKVQFDALYSSTSNKSSDPKAPKASTRKGCERCYNLDINSLCSQSQHSNVEHVLVESFDESIGKENDYLKRQVKKLEPEVNKLKKQTKVQPSQDNHSNMVKKFEKGRTTPKIASQQQRKQVHHMKDEMVKYARSVFLNARRPHIKSRIGYKTSDKHNTRVNTRGQ
jgi:FtsZ-binding cell division protein ZapB